VIKLVLPIGQFRKKRKRFCQNRIGAAKVGICIKITSVKYEVAKINCLILIQKA